MKQLLKESLIQQVWEKSKIIENLDPNVWRLDECGAYIKRDEYGKISEFGWEIDHVKPKSKGGSDELFNLQPLHWENNRAKSNGDGYPKVRFENDHNRVIDFYNILFV